MKHRFLTYLGLASATLSNSLFATGLSVDQAIHEAMEHSPHLERLKAGESEASWKPLEALSENLPKLSVTASHFFGVKYQTLDINFGGNPSTFPLIYPKTDYTLGATWTIFDGMATPERYRAAKLGEEAAGLERKFGELRLQSDIRMKFYRALAAEALLMVAAENVTALEDHYVKANYLVKGGVATKFDLLRIKVQLEEAGPEKVAAEDNVQISRKMLAQAIGIENDARTLDGVIPVPVADRVAGKIDLNLKDRADIEAMRARTEAADKIHTAALGSWLPKVTLSAQKDFYNNTDASLTENLKDAYSVGVILSWNFLDGGANYAKQQSTVYQRDQLDASHRALLLGAPVEVDSWKRKFLYNVSLYQARTRAIEMAEESVRLAKLGLDAGTRTNTDVLDAELDLFRARAGVIRAQVDAAEAYTNLELALGRKIAKD